MRLAGEIVLKGARQNNLRNLDLRLPRHRLVVVTGPSGSGKSSLVFDTLYAEGQRRYLESLSAYARQFLEQVPKPAVDRVEGLSPALAIEQKGLGHNPRSTVGTVTEILPFLRLLFARLGEVHCPDCGLPAASGHPSRLLHDVQALPDGTRYQLLAPLSRGRRGEQRKRLAGLRRLGFSLLRVDGVMQRLDATDALTAGAKHDLDVVVDRLVAGKGSADRLRESIERALALGDGQIILLFADGNERHYNTRLGCARCGRSFPPLEPRLFSFNAPGGQCPRCKGLGRRRQVSEELLIPDPSRSIRDGGLAPLAGRSQSFAHEQVHHLAQALGFSLDTPLTDLDPQLRRAILYGTAGEEFAALREAAQGHERFLVDFEGLCAMIERRAAATKSARVRKWCEGFMLQRRCGACDGTRLSAQARAVRVSGSDLGQLCKLPLLELRELLARWNFEGSQRVVAETLLAEIRNRCAFLVDAGVGYLSLGRAVDSLSGGEGQRVRLATQVGSRLTGVLYILDEPSVGLHARDTAKLIELLQRLRDRGNSVIVVEHDRDIIEAGDHLVDMGPGAGERGGRIVATGTPAELAADPASPTGRWLARRSGVAQSSRPDIAPRWLRLRGLRARNLKNIDFEVPLGRLVAVTGVSGSGKSTAVHDVLYRALARRLYRAHARPLAHRSIEGVEAIQKVILIDQSPIGRSPRSTPATFTGIYEHLRRLFAQTPAARARGFGAGRFSFNTKGGRCEACAGSGVQTLSMDFLPEVSVPCEECRGRRFNRQTLEITYKGHSIAEVLAMEVERAHPLFAAIPPLLRILSTLEAVGLGYLRLGQSSDTLSGGEAQRLKLARELSRPSAGDTLYLLDEPTTGLHFDDVQQLLAVLRRLVDRGNTVLVIEHHPDVILAAEHVIDLGPEGGAGGGEIVVAGPLQSVLECARSHTGSMLRRHLFPSHPA
jgi:excinuclease ABC subunit A